MRQSFAESDGFQEFWFDSFLFGLFEVFSPLFLPLFELLKI